MSRRLVPLVVVLALSAILGVPVASAAPLPPPATGPATSGAMFVPMQPCRVVDTRVGAPLVTGEQRTVQVGGNGAGFAGQGGKAGGCGVPDGALAVQASVTAVSPAVAGGYVRAWPAGAALPVSTFVTYVKGQNVTNNGALTLAPTGGQDLALRNDGGRVHLVVDVQGYYTRSRPVAPGEAAGLYVPVQACRVLDTRGGPPLTEANRDLPVAGSCGVPAEAVAVEVSVTVVTPAAAGYLRVFPAGLPLPTATFLSYAKGQTTTGVGAMAVTPGSGPDLTLRLAGGSAHAVVDVQGYFVPAGYAPPATGGATYVPLVPCRIADTRKGPKVAANGTRALRVRGSGQPATQGSTPGGCGIPADATSVEASITAVNPSTNGYLRVGPPPSTFLTYGKARNVTVTGALTLGTGTGGDLEVANAGGDLHLVVDIQGYYRTTLPPYGTVTRITEGRWNVFSDAEVSGDGRFVSYLREVTYPPTGFNPKYAYLFDRATGVTTEVPRADGQVFALSASTDGRFLAFASTASSLLPGTESGPLDVYSWDRTTGAIVRVSGVGFSTDPDLSGDGRYVAHVVIPDAGGPGDVYVWDRTTGSSVRVTAGNGHSRQPHISDDGRFVAFSSVADDLVPGDTNGKQDAFLWDRTTGVTTRMTNGSADSRVEDLTADGSQVIVQTDASDLIPGETYVGPVYVWDRALGALRRLTLPRGLVARSATITPDGRFVTVTAFSREPTPDEPYPQSEVFVHDTVSAELVRVTGANQGSWTGSSSTDGQVVAFGSSASSFVPGDEGDRQLFIWNREG